MDKCIVEVCYVCVCNVVACSRSLGNLMKGNTVKAVSKWHSDLVLRFSETVDLLVLLPSDCLLILQQFHKEVFLLYTSSGQRIL